MKKGKRVTINDIALATGFSKTTVSFAFNNPRRLPQVTVEKILATAREMGYSPDPLARSMTTRRTGTIGLLLPQDLSQVTANYQFNDLLRGISGVLEKDNRSVLMVSPVRGNMAEAIANAVVDGFISWGLEWENNAVSMLTQRNVPYIMLEVDPRSDIPCVNIDDRAGAYQAMKHVLEQGHRKISILTFLNGNGLEYWLHYGTIRNRIEGYIDALREYDLSIESPTVRLDMSDVTREAGYAAMERAWNHADFRPTALVTMSDTLAIGALDYCHDNGIRVPEDISVVGFDNIPEAALVHPPLTTVEQPAEQKGADAARLLLDMLNGEEVTTQIQLPTRLVQRASVAAAPVELAVH